MGFLELVNINKSFGGIKALQDVSMHVGEGEILGLIGPNGAGKTTLFNIVSGFYRPDDGVVKFKGISLVGLRPDEICLKGIARTFQIVRPFSNLSVVDNVSGALLFGRNGKSMRGSVQKAREKATELLEFGKLTAKGNTLANALTLSERKRLEMIRGLATGPELLLLDEVMAGLNPAETEGMMGMVKRIRDTFSLAIFVIEHNLRAVMGLSDRVAVLDHGIKIADGIPAEIAHDENVIRAYLGHGLSK